MKFRFTGTFPLITTPIFASAPPVDGGKTKPIIFSDPHRFRAQAARRKLAVRACPYVNSRPLESAIANFDQFFRALRRNRRCSKSPRLLRYMTASLPDSAIAWRTSCAVEVAGIGSPNEMVTG